MGLRKVRLGYLFFLGNIVELACLDFSRIFEKVFYEVFVGKWRI